MTKTREERTFMTQATENTLKHAKILKNKNQVKNDDDTIEEKKAYSYMTNCNYKWAHFVVADAAVVVLIEHFLNAQ